MIELGQNYNNPLLTDSGPKFILSQKNIKHKDKLALKFENLEQNIGRKIQNKFMKMKEAAPIFTCPLYSFLYLIGAILFILLIQWHHQQIQSIFRKFSISVYKTKQQLKQQISENNIKFNILKTIHWNLYMKQKESLYIQGQENCQDYSLDDNFLQLLSFSKHNLKNLYLWNQNINDKFFAKLLKQNWFDNLKVLQLNGNKLTDESIRLLLEKKHLSLTWLNIKNNKITEKGMSLLIKNSSMLPNLKYINYEDNQIIDIYKIHYTMIQMLPTITIGKYQPKIN